MFVFYDFETTGTSPAFDPPLQFAAILTDDDFKQVEREDAGNYHPNCTLAVIQKILKWRHGPFVNQMASNFVSCRNIN